MVHLAVRVAVLAGLQIIGPSVMRRGSGLVVLRAGGPVRRFSAPTILRAAALPCPTVMTCAMTRFLAVPLSAGTAAFRGAVPGAVGDHPLTKQAGVQD